MAIEFARRKQNIAVVMLHPGTVDTDLSEPFQKVTVRASAALHSRTLRAMADKYGELARI